MGVVATVGVVVVALAVAARAAAVRTAGGLAAGGLAAGGLAAGARARSQATAAGMAPRIASSAARPVCAASWQRLQLARAPGLPIAKLPIAKPPVACLHASARADDQWRKKSVQRALRTAGASASWRACAHKDNRGHCFVCSPVEWARYRMNKLAERSRRKFPELQALSAEEILGCSPDHFAESIAAKIKSFNERSKARHRIQPHDFTCDHTRPLASFGVARLPQCTVLELCNWRNIQPMTKRLNSKKGDAWGLVDDAMWRERIIAKDSPYADVYLPMCMRQHRSRDELA